MFLPELPNFGRVLFALGAVDVTEAVQESTERSRTHEDLMLAGLFWVTVTQLERRRQKGTCLRTELRKLVE